MKSAISATFD